MTDAGKRFWVWLSRHPSERQALRDVPPDVVSRLWADAFRDGAWSALHDNTQLGLDLTRVLQRMEELANLYRETEIEREADEASAYWRTEVEI